MNKQYRPANGFLSCCRSVNILYNPEETVFLSEMYSCDNNLIYLCNEKIVFLLIMSKILHIILLICTIVITEGCTGNQKQASGTECDSTYVAVHIQNLSIVNPKEALALLDTAEQQGLMDDFELNRLRAVVYHNGFSDNNKSLEYAMKAYDSPSAHEDIRKFLSLIQMIANQYYLNGDYARSVEFCTKGIKIAQDSVIRSAEANLTFKLGRNLLVLNREDEGFGHYFKAVDILDGESEKDNTWETSDDYIYTLAILIGTLRNEGYYDKATGLLPRYEDAVRRLETKEQIPDGLIDMRRASGYGMAAHLYAIKGEKDKAHEEYLKLCSTEYSKTPDAGQLTIPYLFEAGDYREALRKLQEEKKYWQANIDTISYSYIRNHLESELAVHEKLGDIRSANRVLHTIQTLNDSLRIRDRNEKALELAEIYKTNEQAAQLKEQENTIRIRTLIFSFTALLLVVAVGFIIRILRDKRVIQKKNEAMVGTINELMTYKNELFIRREENIRLRDELRQFHEAQSQTNSGTEDMQEPDSTQEKEDSSPTLELTENDRVLYDRMCHEIVSRKLYLNPDFNKSGLMKEIHVPAYKFAALFRKFGGCSFTQYLQDCRIDYAINLMHEYPQWSMDAVAKEAQMSKTSFFRQFQKKYGMSPSNYIEKEQLTSNRQSVDSQDINAEM
ncbi:AraC family transcriptional regulator [Bacteroides sp. AM32-11AC]|nr:AraC family transcriptional regulator [Bacteroides sp. AM32-11AC]